MGRDGEGENRTLATATPEYYHNYILINLWGVCVWGGGGYYRLINMSVYRTFGAHGSPLGKDTLSEEGWGIGGTMASSRSRGKGSASREFSLSSLSSSSSRASSVLKGSFSLKASRFSCFIRAWGRQVEETRQRRGAETDSMSCNMMQQYANQHRKNKCFVSHVLFY